MPIDIKKQLNPSQWEAVRTIDGAVLVIAGAGSGKTRVIEYRVLNLVQQGIDPKSILLLTFTRRASRQMLERASRHDPRCQKVSGGTFHSFAYQLLHKYAPVLGLARAFTVLDEGDAEEAVHRCAAELGFYERQERAPKKRTLKSIISATVNKNLTVQEVLLRKYPQYFKFAQELESLRKRYMEYKVAKNYLDYDDLLVYLKLLLQDEKVAASVNKQYRYVMVDEYQDTNSLQGDITVMLGRHGNIMVVGDDAQSIYGFRGATHGNIMEFPTYFPGCRIIKLEHNYRSIQPILNVANAVLSNMKKRYDKSLKSARDDGGVRPQLNYFQDAYREAEWVAEAIKTKRDEGIDLGRQAVLYRSAYVSIPLQAELTARNIPFAVYGGLKFYETAHVKDVLAYLKVAVNFRDELAWHRLLMLVEGVGAKTSASLTEQLVNLKSPAEAVTYLAVIGESNSRISESARLLAKLFEVLARPDLSVEDSLGKIVAYYRPTLKRIYDDWHDRANDLEALLQISSRYSAASDMLAEFAIEPPQRGVAEVMPETEDEEPVTLSTIHSAKGLEWGVVYFIGLSDGVLPASQSLELEEDVEEERRLFYVGLTRAKDELHLSLHHESLRGGLSQFNKVSRFLDDPGVRDHLDIPASNPESEEVIYLDEMGEVQKSDAKKGLLDRLMDMYKD